MAYPNAFDPATTVTLLARLEQLSPKTQAQWGKMSVSQMLAHVNVPYNIDYSKETGKYSFFQKLMMKWFVKGIVVGDKPYKKNGRTAPNFLITDERDFSKEMEILKENIKKIESLGVSHFEGKENPGFGKLSSKEWSNLYIKHLDHHLTQFGV